MTLDFRETKARDPIKGREERGSSRLKGMNKVEEKER